MKFKLVDVDSLPQSERWFYFIAGITSIVYGINCLRQESERFQLTEYSELLSPGWSWLHYRLRDLTDTEWAEWRVLVWTLVPICLCRVIVTFICRHFKLNTSAHKVLMVAVDSLSLSYITNIRVVLLLCIQAAAMFAVTLTNSTVAVWLLGLALLQSMNSESLVQLKQSYLGMDNDQSLYDMVFTAEAFFYLKIISFGLEKVWYNTKLSQQSRHWTVGDDGSHSEKLAQKKERGRERMNEITNTKSQQQEEMSDSLRQENILCSNPTILDFLHFCLSLPMFFDGPIYNYNDFHNQVEAHLKSDSRKIDIYDIAKRMGRIAFWAVFIEFQCHFLYHQAIHLYPVFVRSMSLPAIITMGYYQGQFFMVKYLCLYGLAMQWLRFEGIQAHDQPRCISWVFSYTDMWKVFDVGLYKFLKMYVFLPTVGRRASLLNKLLSASLVFTFVFVFHGMAMALFIWCGGNFLTTCIETTASFIEISATGEYLKSFLSPANQLRLRAVLIVPVYEISCILMFFFFFGKEVGMIFCDVMYFNASWTNVFLQALIYYVNIQNALYIYDKWGCRK